MHGSAAQPDETCLAAPYVAASSEDQRRLAQIHGDIAPVLDRFPSLSRALADLQPTLCLADRLDNAHAYLTVSPFRIVINRALTRDMQTAVLLHELRHLEQFARGTCPSDDLAMSEYARAVFGLEADASAVSLLVAWRMRDGGDGGAWDALSAWPSQADIAERFDEVMTETADPVRAVSAAFAQWFASDERRLRYYGASCSDYLDRQEMRHSVPRYLTISGTFYDRLCRLPDGTPYPCTDPRAAD